MQSQSRPTSLSLVLSDKVNALQLSRKTISQNDLSKLKLFQNVKIFKEMLKQIKEGKPLEHRFQRRAFDDVPANTTSKNQIGGKVTSSTTTDHKPQGKK